SDLIKGSQLIDQFDELKNIFSLHKLPILLPSNFMSKNNPLENSWNVTSDSIAVYIANQLRIKKVILITDVDGIFAHDPKKDSDAKLIGEMSSKQLEAISERTSVDSFLPKLLSKMQIACFVVNGLFPERVEDILDERNGVYTRIN
ncbi:MAG: amino acid kinase family protein, partial [Candidatus Bathyarchaeia archaeon]